jgi:quercetin dioxygenase-like cupin family protein
MLVTDLNTVEMFQRREGLRVAFPIHSAAGSASTAAVWMVLDPDGALPEHTDSAEELLLVLEGSVEATVGDESAVLGEGQLAVVPALVPHGLRNVGNGRARVLGFFSSATNVAVFRDSLGPEELRVFVIGAPVPLAAPLDEAALVAAGGAS